MRNQTFGWLLPVLLFYIGAPSARAQKEGDWAIGCAFGPALPMKGLPKTTRGSYGLRLIHYVAVPFTIAFEYDRWDFGQKDKIEAIGISERNAFLRWRIKLFFEMGTGLYRVRGTGSDRLGFSFGGGVGLSISSKVSLDLVARHRSFDAPGGSVSFLGLRAAIAVRIA